MSESTAETYTLRSNCFDTYVPDLTDDNGFRRYFGIGSDVEADQEGLRPGVQVFFFLTPEVAEITERIAEEKGMHVFRDSLDESSAASSEQLNYKRRFAAFIARQCVTQTREDSLKYEYADSYFNRHAGNGLSELVIISPEPEQFKALAEFFTERETEINSLQSS